MALDRGLKGTNRIKNTFTKTKEFAIGPKTENEQSQSTYATDKVTRSAFTIAQNAKNAPKAAQKDY